MAEKEQAAAQQPQVKKRERVKIPRGKAFISASFNNTIITITDMVGNTLTWESGGTLEFKGSRKATPYAAQMAARKAAESAKEVGLHELEIYVKGPGVGRESAIRALATSGLKINLIKDITPIPHNGCRARKRRRV